MDIKERLLKNVDMSSGCWIWTKFRDKDGYGGTHINLPGGGQRGVRAHRLAYTVFVGEIPDGKLVLHKCDNPACINPDHLFLGTQSDNIRDCVRKGRFKGGLHRHGPRGENHPFSKITEADVLSIRSEYAAGARQVDLASKYGLHQTTISDIVRRKIWKHV